ncbi:25508_t:CDS:2, partial [Dentiscutata erythropus]
MTFTKFFDDLSNELSNILEDSDDYDVIIQAGKEPEFKEFKAHSVILRARSPYFKVALSDKWMKNKENIYYFPKPNISPAVFHLILRYIYTGILDLKDQPGSNIFALLIAADELLLDRLFGHVQKYLISNELNWIRENLVMIIPTVFKIQRCKEIQDYITNTLNLSINSDSDLYDLLDVADELALDGLINRISEHLIEIKPSWLKENLVKILFNIIELKRCEKIQDSIIKFIGEKELSWLKENIFVFLWDTASLEKCNKLKTYIMDNICLDPETLLFELEDFPRLENYLFLELIERDNLIIEEINVWKYLMKWGMAKFISLSKEKFVNTDINNLGENEFSTFKKYIDPFIPHVRFCEISRAEFYHHVMPFKKVLSKDLYKDLKGYFLADIKPQHVKLQSRIKIDSIIIKKGNAQDIFKWIMETTLIKKPSEVILSHRVATRDRFNSNELIAKLKSSSKVLLIKVKDSDIIIGGYIKNFIYSDFKNDRAEGFVACFRNGKDSNLHESCNIEFQIQYNASS